MAKMECHFFTGSPAVWTCTKCSTCYGNQCIPAGNSRHWGRGLPACIRCNSRLQYLGGATDAKPFWQMLPHFFIYPLQANSLIVLGLLAALSLLFEKGFLGLGAALLATAILVKYSFAIIEKRGQGQVKAPELGAVISGDEHHLFLRQIGLFFLMGLSIAAAGQIHPVLGLIVMAFLVLAIPASTLLLAINKSVLTALNPFALISLMLAVGWPYLLLWFCTQIVAAGPVYIIDWIAAALPTVLILPVTMLLMAYFMLVLYTMLGYVLFEYQHELGYQSEAEDHDDDLDYQAFSKARALGEAAVYISDSEYTLARNCLRQALDTVRDDADLHMQYHKLLMLLDDDTALVNHSNYLIELFKTQHQLARAVKVVRDTQTRIADFTPADTRAAIDIAQLMVNQGMYRPAVKLFQNHHKRQPDDPLLSEAYLLVARTLVEFLNEDEKASTIARFIIKKYPNCAQRQDFEALLKMQGTVMKPAVVAAE